MEDISYNFFWTSNVSIKKEYIDKAGRFDEDFREYGWEDIELGLRDSHETGDSNL
jgi:predicted glycosyltransferase involved in capsule biosynthesis